MQNTIRQSWEERYRSGKMPWDTAITPPEVQAFWARGALSGTGTALDLGCGTGTNAVFLAEQGLFAVGVDLAGTALAFGRERLAGRHSQLAQRVSLVQADVTQLPFRALAAVYVLDIGCLHALPPERRPDYAAGVVENLVPGGYYHLYAFDRLPPSADDPSIDWRGLEADEVERLFAPALTVVEIVRARPEPHPCRWYLLRK